jgi:hypothetical protein
MSCTFVIDPERHRVDIRMWGDLTRDEVLSLTAQISADPRLGPAFSELVDLRDVTSSAAITADDLRALASSPLDPVARRAVVAPDTSTSGLARMFQAHRAITRAHEQIAVFRTLEEAEAWLRDGSG